LEWRYVVEELKPQDIEDLLQELEEEDSTQESPPPEVEETLRVLQSGTLYLGRRDAAEQLGRVGTSSPRIIRVLRAAQESDPHPEVRRTAAKSLRAPVHEEYLEEPPDLMEATMRALQQRPGADRQLPRSDTGTDKQLHRTDTKGALLSRRLLMWSSVAGLAVGLVVGLGLADPNLSSSVSLGCGAVFVVALTAGAVLGTVVGAVVRGPKDRITGMIVGAILAGVVASLSWFPFMIWRIIEMGGP
jgi:hypothetical protein